MSLVRTNHVGHLRDVRRLIVTMSRARLGLYAPPLAPREPRLGKKHPWVGCLAPGVWSASRVKSRLLSWSLVTQIMVSLLLISCSYLPGSRAVPLTASLHVRQPSPSANGIRPISLLRISLLRLLDSNLSQTL